MTCTQCNDTGSFVKDGARRICFCKFKHYDGVSEGYNGVTGEYNCPPVRHCEKHGPRLHKNGKCIMCTAEDSVINMRNLDNPNWIRTGVGQGVIDLTTDIRPCNEQNTPRGSCVIDLKDTFKNAQDALDSIVPLQPTCLKHGPDFRSGNDCIMCENEKGRVILPNFMGNDPYTKLKNDQKEFEKWCGNDVITEEWNENDVVLMNELRRSYTYTPDLYRYDWRTHYYKTKKVVTPWTKNEARGKWVRNTKNAKPIHRFSPEDVEVFIYAVSGVDVMLEDMHVTYQDLLENFEQIDGSPCGTVTWKRI